MNPRKLAWAHNWCRLNSCRGVAEWPYSAAALVRVDKRVHPSAGGAAGQHAAILWRRSDLGTRGGESRQATCQVVVLVVAAHGRDTRLGFRYTQRNNFGGKERTSLVTSIPSWTSLSARLAYTSTIVSAAMVRTSSTEYPYPVHENVFCHRCLRIEGTTGSAGATPSARAQRSARRALIAHERCSMMAGTSHSARSGWPKSVREGKGGGAGNVWAAPAVQDCTAEAKRPCLGSGRSGGQLGACGRAPRARGVRACSSAAVGTTGVARPRSLYSMYTCCEAVEHPPAV